MITSEDCKLAIAASFAVKTLNLRGDIYHLEKLTSVKNWKRISKHGNADKGFIRKFYNKEVDITINVHSTEDEIKELKRSKGLETKPKKGTGLLALIKRIEAEEEGSLAYNLPWSDKDGIPKVAVEQEPGEEPELEDVDFENFDVDKVTDSEITVSAGGDWQPCTTWTAYLGTDGLLHCLESHATTDDEKEEWD